MKIANFQTGIQPWEALYHTVINKPEMIHFHIEETFRIQSKTRFILGQAISYFTQKTNSPFKKCGGELLTRCNPEILPQQYIGSAFQHMPPHAMKKMFPILLQQQLEFISRLDVIPDVSYSINLEGIDYDLEVWKKVCNLLMIHRQLPINVEIKENCLLSPNILIMLAEICKNSRIRIFIDDLCSYCHELPDYEDYIIMVIQHLDRYIQAVKVDYAVMNKIMYLEQFYRVKNNLRDLRWLWESHSRYNLPMVIFESLPILDRRWIMRLHELADGYCGIRFQRG